MPALIDLFAQITGESTYEAPAEYVDKDPSSITPIEGSGQDPSGWTKFFDSKYAVDYYHNYR